MSGLSHSNEFSYRCKGERVSKKNLRKCSKKDWNYKNRLEMIKCLNEIICLYLY